VGDEVSRWILCGDEGHVVIVSKSGHIPARELLKSKCKQSTDMLSGQTFFSRICCILIVDSVLAEEVRKSEYPEKIVDQRRQGVCCVFCTEITVILFM